MNLLSETPESARRKHADAEARLTAAQSAVEETDAAYRAAVAGHELNEEAISLEALKLAQKARDTARDQHERAQIAFKASEQRLANALKADEAAKLDTDWRRCEGLAVDFRKAVDRFVKHRADLNSAAERVLSIADEINSVSPYAKARPEVPEFWREVVRNRLGRDVEVLAPCLFQVSESTKFSYPGLIDEQSLSAFCNRHHGEQQDAA